MYKILLSTLLVFTFLTSVQAEEKKPTVTQEAPKPIPLSMTDIKGTTYKITGTDEGLVIEGLEDKVVFLEFFGHQCPPCLASIPHLIELQKKHKKELAIVAIEVQGYNTEKLTAFAKEKGMNYIVVSEQMASELVMYIQQRAQWSGGIPFLVALDKTGNVQFIQAGMLPPESLEALVKDLSTLPEKKEVTPKKEVIAKVENNASIVTERKPSKVTTGKALEKAPVKQADINKTK